MNVLIRADSSSSIGTGHIMRDLVLASRFENVSFATRDLSGNINFKIKESDYDIYILKDNTLEELAKAIAKHLPDLVIIDNYDIDYEFEKSFKEKYPDIKLMVLDDVYDKHYCDVLLNHNIYADKRKYKNLVPKTCDIRCGSDYTLLREEFYKYKSRVKYHKDKNKFLAVFVAMGGADHSNINIPILNVIEKVGGISVNIITTSANRNLEELKNYCLGKPWINMYINSSSVAKLMSESDFAIVTPSVTVNEVCFMEIPLIAIKTAQNQTYMFDYLKSKDICVLEHFEAEKLSKAISKFKERVW
ncbi:UDP-2,4-diacetamido-2,4,6-trideoxy-beta-L-altropyranose hydrolase [Francisella sp. 19X1-34]|uniref:UDP-2,4-diacetamido-2,4, 6-trideoxy-beta-L-altropyranose hydrolase n=1 Tax=Francisella sp. 19X1-34 TaxID=3087177 RepID=UPI002E329A3C|nr:UDP-2,4-diacetamido-2,4,6-trideoxy-beta-L-altropyranose hydrolase [Francisella sp. 19X1-34]MED7787533.1 UDP-2,4-diacetamido-2,4,6-trideoxy-beta-L-altropyranose hydrolase [Francisella sp. 19X1-34]